MTGPSQQGPSSYESPDLRAVMTVTSLTPRATLAVACTAFNMARAAEEGHA